MSPFVLIIIKPGHHKMRQPGGCGGPTEGHRRSPWLRPRRSRPGAACTAPQLPLAAVGGPSAEPLCRALAASPRGSPRKELRTTGGTGLQNRRLALLGKGSAPQDGGLAPEWEAQIAHRGPQRSEALRYPSVSKREARSPAGAKVNTEPDKCSQHHRRVKWVCLDLVTLPLLFVWKQKVMGGVL
ncbi:uncharacterized protein LOC116652749 [Coturnix japonica]|uniref:uncharacterized protein LOC116652749 n=1 Tax=Coturnix japonica TaxID=93934 RepID=UPI0013A5D405|nr:uncharacterized protein LOC116652749 [Coturnix japonica]